MKSWPRKRGNRKEGKKNEDEVKIESKRVTLWGKIKCGISRKNK